MEVIGVSKKPIDAGLAPLDHLQRFNGHSSPVFGYFLLIAPSFQEFVLFGDSIEGLHVLARVAGASLQRGLDVCAEVEANILSKPEKWRECIGTTKKPGQPERPLQPLVIRRRALEFMHRIRRLFEIAQSEQAEVIFANGAFYVPLSGIELPPGVEYYS
ncbi:hypothetical protein [Massilia sp. BJB1822]|uniref:hypothetical protein n=1 Tax=Massilia sp. BJB1822 TaxID=2744470 RepID=UPI00159428C8|nr:hypothetical protein [Massilia sp. BJB1822]NVD97591.1 hypothetical protein [Massilia sp. BJB1822]